MSEVLSIVINNNSLRIALLSRGRGTTHVRALLEKECPEGTVDDSIVKKPKAFGEFIRQQLNSANIHAREAVFTLPADKLMTREIVLPGLSDARIRQIVDTNAGEYFPINLDDYVIGFYRIAPVRDKDQSGARNEAGEGADGLLQDSDLEISDLYSESGDPRQLKKQARAEKRRRKHERSEKRRDRTNETADSAHAGKKRKRGEVRVMVIAAPNEMVSSLYETAECLHLHVRSIDFIGNSVFRLAKEQVGTEPTLTVDISGDHTALTFFDSGDMIMQRNVDFGLDQIIDIVARERWVSNERADELLRTSEIISEDLQGNDPIAEPLFFSIDMIRRTMMYYTRNRGMAPVERVLLMGDAVCYKGLRELLESQLAVPVTSLTSLKGVQVPRSGSLHEQAMRYLDNYGAVIAPVGFLSQELSASRIKSRERKAYRWILIGAALGSAMLIAWPTAQFFRLRKDTEELKKETTALKGADAVLAAYDEARLRGDDVRNAEGLIASNNDELPAFIDQLERVRPTGLSIQSFTIDEGEITMTILASGKDVVAAMLRSLQTIDNVSEVEASALTSYYDTGSETVSCTVTCMLTSKAKRDYEATAEGGSQ